MHNSTFIYLLLVLLEEDSSIVTTEAQVGAHGSLDFHFPLLVGDIVQVAFRIRRLVVGCRRNNAVGNAACNDDSLETTSSSQSMARNALGRTDDELAILGGGMITRVYLPTLHKTTEKSCQLQIRSWYEGNNNRSSGAKCRHSTQPEITEESKRRKRQDDCFNVTCT